MNFTAETGRVTLRNIARLARVDVSTVSLALRGSPRVAASTKARIKEIANQLGYRPDPALAALNAYRDARRREFRQVVAWLTNFPPQAGSWRSRTIYAEYFRGASLRAEAYGYRLEEFALRGGEVPASRMLQILETRGVRGILLCPQPSMGELAHFDFSPFAAVTFGYSLRTPRLHLVSNHQFLSIRLAAEKLRLAGYRRIGLALPADYHESLQWQTDGAFHAFLERCGPLPRDLVFKDKSWSLASFSRWLRRMKPDAIIVDPNTMHGWWPQLGLRVPEDLGVASFTLASEDHDWSGIHQNNDAIGAAGFDLLQMLLHRNECGVPTHPIRLLIEGVWRDGPTTLQPNARAESSGSSRRPGTPDPKPRSAGA